MSTLSNEKIKEAREILEKMKSVPELMDRIRLEEESESDYATKLSCAREEALEEGKKEGLEKGLKEGLKEGEMQAKIELAKKMLEKGMTLETIVELTELSLEEIEKLR